LATVLVFLFGFLGIVKNFLFFLSRKIIFLPIRTIVRWFFYNVFIKIYLIYLSFLKKIGISGLGVNLFSILFNQKLVHVLVVILTISVMFVNLTSKTQADNQVNDIKDTIIAQLIKSEFSDLPEEDQLVIETFDKEAVITDIHQSYLDNLSAFKPQLKASLGEEETIDELLDDKGSLVRRDQATTKISKKPREKIIKYIVQSGDTISTIAEEFDISVSTILWENELTAYSIIRPGKELDILPVSGITHVVKKGENVGILAKEYSVEEAELIKINKLENEKLAIGQKVIIPGGKKVYQSYTPKTYTGYTAIKELVTTPPASKVTLGNKMQWPTVGNRITQYYSWKHHGLDIANKIGTPLYAADSGVVEVVGWGTGYGNQILIDHGGGKKTRYAHCSKFYVSDGEKVKKGQAIAAMGSTGWSTGSHIHFEVIINGVKYNPLNYIR